jgi:hypothetical protein
MRNRGIAVAALAIPVLAGLAYLFAFGAPASYLAVNAAVLAVAILWIAVALPPPSSTGRRVLIGALLLLLFVPLLTGPSLSGVARWLPLGPFNLHAGMLAVPLLATLAGEEPEYAPLLLSLALLAAFLQPDMATGAALMLAAVGLYDATRDWRHVVFAIVAFTASLVAAMRGELPAHPFVERVIFLLARTDLLAALGLLAALLASFYLIVGALPGRESSRKALAGSLFGFSFAGLVSNYPSPLIGYGAAPILGFGLALGLLARQPRTEAIRV